MPYILKEFKDGFKVCKADEPEKCFSNEPIPKERAKRQMKAIGMSGKGKEKKNYVIAIPSYDREKIIKEKTLKILEKIDKSIIYIFVADEKEKEKYEKEIGDEYKIIVGKKGISYQRNFIIDYFDEGVKIVFIDDDISNIMIKKNNKVKKLTYLNKFFEDSFKKLEKEKVFLWATKNMYNPFYKNLMKEEGVIGLYPFSGDLIGLINRKNMKIEYTIKKGEAEQYELLFKYYEKDGGILLFNNVVIITAKLTKGGKTSERGGVEERKKDIIPNLKILKKHYPQYIKKLELESDENIYTDRAKLQLEKIHKKTIKGAGKQRNINFEDKDSDDIYVYKLEQNKKINDLKKDLYELLKNTRIPKIEGKRKDGNKTRGDLLGYNAYTMTFGCGGRRNLGIGEFSPNEKHPELFDLLIKYGNTITPKGYKYNIITVNKNMKAKKHIDSRNEGFSVITSLGDFTGGGLYVYKNGKKELYDLKDNILIFNGSKLYHMTEKFKGERYTIIFYAHKSKCEIKGKKLIGD